MCRHLLAGDAFLLPLHELLLTQPPARGRNRAGGPCTGPGDQARTSSVTSILQPFVCHSPVGFQSAQLSLPPTVSFVPPMARCWGLGCHLFADEELEAQRR